MLQNSTEVTNSYLGILMVLGKYLTLSGTSGSMAVESYAYMGLTHHSQVLTTCRGPWVCHYRRPSRLAISGGEFTSINEVITTSYVPF